MFNLKFSLRFFAVFAIPLIFAISACGGGDEDHAVDKLPDPGVSQNLRVTVDKESILLTAQMEKISLRGRVVGADGVGVDKLEVTYTSSNPTDVSVDSTGHITALSKVGSAIITVSAVGSIPREVPVAVVEPWPAVILVADDSVGSDPVQEVALAINQPLRYKIEWIGQGLPELGSLIMSRGAKKFGGRVVDSYTDYQGAKKYLYIEAVSLSALLKNVSIAFSYQKLRTNEQMKPLNVAGTTARARPASIAPMGGASCGSGAYLGDFKFLSDKSNISLDPFTSAAIDIDVSSGNLNHLKILAGAKLKAELVAEFGVAASGEVACKVALDKLDILLPGVIGFLINPMLYFDFATDISAKIPTALTFQSSAKLAADVRVGFDYSAGIGVIDLTNVTVDEPIYSVKSLSVINGGSVASKLRAGLGVILGVENRFIKGAEWFLIDGFAGPAITWNGALPIRSAIDVGAPSDDKSTIEISVGLDMAVQNFIDQVFGKIIKIDIPVKLTSELPISQSIKMVRAEVDKVNFNIGEELTFSITLDKNNLPATSTEMHRPLRLVVYDVDDTTLNGAPLQSIVINDLSETAYIIKWVATFAGKSYTLKSGKASDSRFYVFAVSEPLAAFREKYPLRLGGVLFPPEIVQQPISTSVLQGGLANFHVDVAAVGETSYQWYRDNKPILGENSKTLIVKASEDANNSSYHVSITSNSVTAYSDLAFLKVNTSSVFSLTGPAIDGSLMIASPEPGATKYSGSGDNISLQTFGDVRRVAGEVSVASLQYSQFFFPGGVDYATDQPLPAGYNFVLIVEFSTVKFNPLTGAAVRDLSRFYTMCSAEVCKTLSDIENKGIVINRSTKNFSFRNVELSNDQGQSVNLNGDLYY